MKCRPSGPSPTFGYISRLEALEFELATPSGIEAERFSRTEVEAAMDAYDAYSSDGSHGEVFGAFGDPRDYWVRSTRPEKPNYPTKPLVGYLLETTRLNGGWNREAAATLLHNSGYIIVDADGYPQSIPDHSYLLREADRIRACARNYYIEPAREAGASTVQIRSGDLAREMGLTNVHPNICSALGSREFSRMIGTPPPEATEPNPSSSTVFTFALEGEKGSDPTRSQPEDQAEMPAAPINLILYGPPGTGKTFETAAEALRLCGEEVPEDRGHVMEAYESLRKDKRIEFVTFHQSTSYEDFVEGRQPVTDEDDSAGFRLETIKGVFREIAERAERGVAATSQEETISLDGRQVFKLSIGRTFLESDNYLFEEAIEQGHILIGWENIDFSDERYEDPEEILAICKAEGKREGQVSRHSGQVKMIDIFRNRLELGDIVIVTKGNKLVRAIGEVTGDYEYVERDTGVYCHRRKTRWLWVDPEGVPAEDIYERQFVQATTYRLRKEDLKIAVIERYMNNGLVHEDRRTLPFVLIIDEINRANISKVFGELITLLEPDKRLGQPNALTVRLPYSRQDFGVPSNLHILGTMNTADRSIALLDTALRRRFLFREMMPKPEVLEDAKARCGLDLPAILRTLNERIEYFYDREHQVGHAYFINCQSQQDVDEAMRHKVIPLLAEYFFEDWSKVAAILGDARADESAFVGGFMRREILTPPPGLEDHGDSAVRFRWSLRSQDEGFDYAGLTGS
jgi:5-methylcytosine-specific restriction protein B